MTQALTKTDALKKSVAAMGDQFQAVLPEHISVKKFVRTVHTAIMSNPSLSSVERNAFFKSCMNAASDGLLPDGKEAAIVPFNSKGGKSCTYMPMVNGILKKVRNSGELATITSQVVYQEDEFEYWIDTQGEHIRHTPQMFTARGVVLGAYAMAKTKSGEVYIEVMSLEELNKVRNASRAKDSGPWKTWESEMFRKTVIKRLSKRLPMSTDVELVIRREDEDLYETTDPAPEPAPVSETPANTERLVNEATQETQEPIDVPVNNAETDGSIPI